jgi:hypothetical protein
MLAPLRLRPCLDRRQGDAEAAPCWGIGAISMRWSRRTGKPQKRRKAARQASTLVCVSWYSIAPTRPKGSKCPFMVCLIGSWRLPCDG